MTVDNKKKRSGEGRIKHHLVLNSGLDNLIKDFCEKEYLSFSAFMRAAAREYLERRRAVEKWSMTNNIL